MESFHIYATTFRSIFFYIKMYIFSFNERFDFNIVKLLKIKQM